MNIGQNRKSAPSSTFIIEHSCGMRQLRRGNEVGRVVITTAYYGKSIGARCPIGQNPQIKDVETRLMKANATQFGMRE